MCGEETCASGQLFRKQEESLRLGFVIGLCIQQRRIKQAPSLILIGRPRQYRWFDLDTAAFTRCTAGIDLRQRTNQGDAARVEFDEAAAGFEGQLGASLDDHFLPGFEVDLLAGFGQLRAAEFKVLALADGEVVVGFDLDLALAGDGQVFFGFQLGVAVFLHGIVALVADADFLLVFDVFVPIALGVQVDLFGAFLVLNTQLVVAATTGTAKEGLK